MVIGGFQKLTLLDYPQQMAAIVFTSGCNFRCPFCHNASLVEPERFDGQLLEASVMDYLEKRHGILDGVVVTGGEPLLQPGLEAFLRTLHEMGYLVKLDTNGSFPKRLAGILNAGLADYVAMDIKHRPDAYAQAIGPGNPDAAEHAAQSLALLRASGVAFELRTTFVQGLHEASDAAAIAKWIAGPQPYYLQSYADSGDVLDAGGLGAFSPAQMQQMLYAAREFCPAATLRG